VEGTNGEVVGGAIVETKTQDGSRSGLGGQATMIDRRQQKKLLKEKMRRGDERARLQSCRVDVSSRVVQHSSDTGVGAHFGQAGQGPEMDLQSVI
jgi:hypothetical protein